MKTEMIEKIAALATAAFGLVAALAWNGAIQAIFAKYYAAGEGISAAIIYAVIVTILAVLITVWIGKAADKIKSRAAKK
jgi:membrane protein YdbS with pleckstrin-like domain